MKLKQIAQKYLINNIGYKILALVFAFLLWLVILNIQDPTITKVISGIPVVIENESIITDNHVYTIKSGDTAAISISGRRSVVNNLNAQDFIGTADFEKLSITNAVPITVSLVDDMTKYQSQIEITQKTTMMVINLETVTSKTMGVDVVYEGVKPDNLVIEKASVSPSFIKVTGPESVLDSLSTAAAVIEYGNIDESGIFTVAPTLYDEKGNVVETNGDTSVDTEELTVTLKVSYKKEVPVSITAQGTPASGYYLKDVVLSGSKVTLKGSKDVLNGISRIVLPSSLLDVTGENRNVSITVNLKDYLPEGTTLYDEEEDTVVIMAQIVATGTTN